MRLTFLVLSPCIALADVCKDFCELNKDICGKDGSYCKNKHACHDLFWTDATRTAVCSSSITGCPQSNHVLCQQVPSLLLGTLGGGRTDQVVPKPPAVPSKPRTLSEDQEIELALALSLAEEEKAKQATQPPVPEGDIKRPGADPAQLDEEEQVRLALALSLVDKKQSSGSDSGNTSKSGSPQNQPVHSKKSGKEVKGNKGHFRPVQGNAADNGKPLSEDESIALAIAESLKDQPVAQEYVRDPRPGRLGFHNMGATCYLATAVQLLGHLRIVRERLLAPNAVLTNPNPVASAFLSTLRHMWERAEETEGEPIEPAELVAALHEAAGPGKFLPNKMEDAHEALWYILDSLSEATSPREGARIPSVIDNIFGTVFKNSKTCNLCTRSAPVMEHLLEVLVPIPKTLPEGIESITLEETFRARQQEEDVDGYACTSCDAYTPARGKSELIASGEVVVFVMKRFTGEGIKIDTPVEFPMVLDFLPTGVYDLVGVGHHRGGSVKSGHYTSEFFHDVHNEWVDGNDRAVVSKEGLPTTVSRTAYILVYQRRTA